jgi:hypothetical protein
MEAELGMCRVPDSGGIVSFLMFFGAIGKYRFELGIVMEVNGF